ncbi:MAG: hypothetical protein ACFB9M_18755 [Myxococcota bacterium]
MSTHPIESRPPTWIPGAEAGESAVEFYVDMVESGQESGGLQGALQVAAGYAGGVTAALWTRETAMDTTVALGAVSGTALGGAYYAVGALMSAYEGSVHLTEAATGTTSGAHLSDAARALTGEPVDVNRELSGQERVAGVGVGVLNFVTALDGS